MAPTLDPDHPRPTLQRAGWSALDGTWSCHLDADGTIDTIDAVPWSTEVQVPFAPETEASGLGHTGYLRRVWYRRVTEVEPPCPGERLLVHLGAVDRVATVWCNGTFVGTHTGGSTPFTCDVTAALGGATTLDLVVRADDDPVDLTVPRGKQCWKPEPHEIFYPRTTGIWQRVWLERVADCRVQEVLWRSDATTVALDIELSATPPPGSWLEITVHAWPAGTEHPDDRPLLRERVALDRLPLRNTVRRTLDLLAGAPERVDALRWWPHAPNLVVADLRILDASGETVDEATTYTGLRTVAVEDGQITVNGFRTPLRLALDQGYWPDTGMTARNGDVLRRDVELALALGLNGVRKHQKVEDPRFLFWADRLGLLVWGEQPSAYLHSSGTVTALAQEWGEAVRRDRNHPSIIAWVPINESWGVALGGTEHRDAPAHRATVEALTALTRALDPTRLVSANDGWETLGGDIVGVHDYTNDPAGFVRRYATADAVDETVRRRRPSGRAITLDGSGPEGRAVLVTEFGGLTLADDADGLFSYGNTTSVEQFLDRYGALCAVLGRSRAIAGWCWTQLTDTYQEANGLLHADRSPKAPIEQLRAAALGQRPGS